MNICRHIHEAAGQMEAQSFKSADVRRAWFRYFLPIIRIQMEAAIEMHSEVINLSEFHSAAESFPSRYLIFIRPYE